MESVPRLTPWCVASSSCLRSAVLPRACCPLRTAMWRQWDALVANDGRGRNSHRLQHTHTATLLSALYSRRRARARARAPGASRGVLVDRVHPVSRGPLWGTERTVWRVVEVQDVVERSTSTAATSADALKSSICTAVSTTSSPLLLKAVIADAGAKGGEARLTEGSRARSRPQRAASSRRGRRTWRAATAARRACGINAAWPSAPTMVEPLALPWRPLPRARGGRFRARR